MNRLILGVAAVGSAALITSAVPASAAPISPVPMSIEQEADGVTKVHSRGYAHRHCVYRYGERRCWSHGPTIHLGIYPGVRFGYKYRDRDHYKFRRFDDGDRKFRGGDDGRRFRDDGRRGGGDDGYKKKFSD